MSIRSRIRELHPRVYFIAAAVILLSIPAFLGLRATFALFVWTLTACSATVAALGAWHATEGETADERSVNRNIGAVAAACALLAWFVNPGFTAADPLLAIDSESVVTQNVEADQAALAALLGGDPSSADSGPETAGSTANTEDRPGPTRKPTTLDTSVDEFGVKEGLRLLAQDGVLQPYEVSRIRTYLQLESSSAGSAKTFRDLLRASTVIDDRGADAGERLLQLVLDSDSSLPAIDATIAESAKRLPCSVDVVRAAVRIYVGSGRPRMAAELLDASQAHLKVADWQKLREQFVLLTSFEQGIEVANGRHIEGHRRSPYENTLNAMIDPSLLDSPSWVASNRVNAFVRNHLEHLDVDLKITVTFTKRRVTQVLFVREVDITYPREVIEISSLSPGEVRQFNASASSGNTDVGRIGNSASSITGVSVEAELTSSVFEDDGLTESNRRRFETRLRDFQFDRLGTETNSIGMKFRRIPTGTFLMGSDRSTVTEADRDETPRHRVEISVPLFVGVTEVTQDQWFKVMGTRPWAHPKLNGRYAPQAAATAVSYNDARKFCEKLSEQEGRPYRLPTEAEWEYACRAAATTRWSFGDNRLDLPQHAVYRSNRNASRGPGDVAQHDPNAWGLFDMHGNAGEWVGDYYESRYYGKSPATDPTGPSRGDERGSRVYRGGTWDTDANECRSGFRQGLGPGAQHLEVGFRVVYEQQSVPNPPAVAAVSTGRTEAPKPKPTPAPRAAAPVAGTNRPTNATPGGFGTQNSIGMMLVPIPAGSFLMGSPDTERERDDDETQREAVIAKPFLMGTHEVTIAQILKWLNDPATEFDKGWFDVADAPVMRTDGSFGLRSGSEFGQSTRQPIVSISGSGAMAFCEWLSGKEGTTYRLPTEAEWEYACRAGSTTAFYWGDSNEGLNKHAWHGENSDDATHPVGQKQTNRWGLFDITGNVFEWTTVPDESRLVYRGGSWRNSEPKRFRSANRASVPVGFTMDSVGFRVVAEFKE